MTGIFVVMTNKYGPAREHALTSMTRAITPGVMFVAAIV
jgi:hypothetical protein